MKVLVATGSKYGSTREIGNSIEAELAERGFDVEFMDAMDVRVVEPYDAVIVGSAVYGGLWRRDASDLLKQHVQELRRRDVWTFSVGIETLVHPGQPKDEAYALCERVGAHGHERFVGAIDSTRLNVGERALIRTLRPPLGDFRDFAVVRAWANKVGTQLAELAMS